MNKQKPMWGQNNLPKIHKNAKGYRSLGKTEELFWSERGWRHYNLKQHMTSQLDSYNTLLEQFVKLE